MYNITSYSLPKYYIQVYPSENYIPMVILSPIIQACLPQWPPFLQHALQQCCNHPGILSSMAEILLFDLVFYDGVASVSVSILKSLLGVIGALPLKP